MGGSGSFITGVDMGADLVECDPHAQMPCPEGQKCSAAGRNGFIWVGTPACYPILGDKQHGEACDLGVDGVDGLDDCAAGLACVGIYLNFDFSQGGVCVQFCDPPIAWNGLESYTCADPEETCFFPGCQECQLSFCTPTCDPLAPECPGDKICVFYGNAFFCRGGWGGVDLPGPGEPCDDFYQCLSGAECVLADTVASPACADAETCCASFCDLNAPNDCPGKDLGEICQPFLPEPFDPEVEPWGEKYNKLGLCQLP